MIRALGVSRAQRGWAYDGGHWFDATRPGNVGTNGHAHGTDLSPEGRRELIEYLNTR